MTCGGWNQNQNQHWVYCQVGFHINYKELLLVVWRKNEDSLQQKSNLNHFLNRNMLNMYMKKKVVSMYSEKLCANNARLRK